MKGIKLLLVMLLTTSSLSAQDTQQDETFTPSQMRKVARHAERKGDSFTAIEFYEKYFERTKDEQVLFNLAEQYRLSRDYVSAEKTYEKCYDASHGNNKHAQFQYARMLKMNGKYDKAKAVFRDFLETGIKFKDWESFKKLAAAELEGCDKLYIQADSMKVVHLDSTINHAYIEGSPIFLDDSTMAYASFQADSIQYVSDGDPAKIKRLYLANKENGTWKGQQLWHEPFNKRGMDISNGALSPDGKRFYFTRCRQNWKGKTICAVYVSESRGGRWKEPFPVHEINSKKFTTTQPAVAKDIQKGSEILYFISDRPGGKGGMDLWYSVYNPRKKSYSTPQNAGPQINTAGDEFTPYFDNESQSLYFSSTGWPGLGGFDVFKTEGRQKNWQLPQNMGTPVNTSVDDIYFIVNPAINEGFIVSNRPGTLALKSETCCDDIYAFNFRNETLKMKGLITQVEDTSNIKYFGKVENNRKYAQPVSGAAVSLFKNINQEDLLIYKDSTDENGEYTLVLQKNNDYTLQVEKEGFFSYTTSLSTRENSNNNLDFALEKISSQPIIIKNINYAFAQYELTDSLKKILDRTLLQVLINNPSLTIEISSHTDNIGGEDFNMNLSEKRANRVARYLISKGVEKDRLLTSGFGESKPIAPNTLSDGIDNPAGREMNRRTEFRVIDNLTKN